MSSRKERDSQQDDVSRPLSSPLSLPSLFSLSFSFLVSVFAVAFRSHFFAFLSLSFWPLWLSVSPRSLDTFQRTTFSPSARGAGHIVSSSSFSLLLFFFSASPLPATVSSSSSGKRSARSALISAHTLTLALSLICRIHFSISPIAFLSLLPPSFNTSNTVTASYEY